MLKEYQEELQQLLIQFQNLLALATIGIFGRCFVVAAACRWFHDCWQMLTQDQYVPPQVRCHDQFLLLWSFCHCPGLRCY
jgi:hypothetical protein